MGAETGKADKLEEVLQVAEQNKAAPVRGRKGTETRARLLAATRELLKTTSPFNLTVAAIAKAANTAPATLYVYFEDVQDVFYALSVDACRDFEEMTRNHTEWFDDLGRIESDAQQFVDEFNKVWDQHSHVLLYRNLESDRGNTRFQELRTTNALPIIDRLSVAAANANPELSKREAYAEAIVLYCSVERLAATQHQIPADRPRLPPEELSRAQARVIARHFGTKA